MNNKIELNEDNTETFSTGERLKLARENLGFTQEHIAEKLCLKVSTVRDIEEDNCPSDLDYTFLRGYIRSYARLVDVSEEELFPSTQKQQKPVCIVKKEEFRNFSLDKNNHTKPDHWLKICSWILGIFILSLIISWLLQNHHAKKIDSINSSQDQIIKNDDFMIHK